MTLADPPYVRVVGEALMDLVGGADGIYTAHPGGSPANVAVDLARMDIPVTFHGRISRDTFGRTLRHHLASNRVDLSGVVPAAEPTTLAVATLDPAGVASYDFWTTGTADWQWREGELPERLPESTVALHTGSLAAWLVPSARPVAALLEREHARGRVTLSLDPNCRPDLMGEPAQSRVWIEHLVTLVDLVKVSGEDLAWLSPGEPPEAVAARWLGLGPALVVVTLGSDGAYGVNRQDTVTVPARPVPIVDTIGAGDAFTAGLLAGLYRRDLLGDRAALASIPSTTLREVLAHASQVAGLTCARAGALGPLTVEIERMLGNEGGGTRPEEISPDPDPGGHQT